MDDSEPESQTIELEKLRTKLREAKTQEREKKREYLLKKARFLEDQQVSSPATKEEFVKIVSSLKSKSQVSCESLNIVMNSLLDSKENIQAFLSVDGGLPSLLRELSGQNEKYQLIAARCICNLALGNKKQSFQVLKASESYLLAHLSGRNRYVMEACAIAIGNFSRHGVQHIKLLLNQGFLLKITNLLNNADEDLESSVIYALTQLIYYGFDIVSTEQLRDSVVACLSIFKKRSFAAAFLVSLLSARKDCLDHFLSHATYTQAVQCLLIALKENEKEALYHLRIVSNCVAEESGKMARDLIEGQGYVLRECVKRLLQSEKFYLRKECLGMVGNLLNHPVKDFEPFAVRLINEHLNLFQACIQSGADGSGDVMEC